MILFNSDMQTEKLAVAGLVIIIVIALSAYIITNEDIIGNLFEDKEPKPNEGVIELGDCVDIHYVGKLSDGEVFDSSYNDSENKTGGTPAKFFMSYDEFENPSDDYSQYMHGIEGFVEQLIGMSEGESAIFDPIPPEKAYGAIPKIGDIIQISNESLENDIKLEFIDIQENVSLPEEYAGFGFADPTTLYVVKDQTHFVGEKMTFHLAWENASVVTKMNDTTIWTYTTPPEDKTTDFTWISIDPTTGQTITYWENKSSAEVNDTHIVITHSPEIGENISLAVEYYQITYTVVNLTEDKINLSYDDDEDGNLSYYEIDRTITIVRNETQDIVFYFPPEFLDYLINYIFNPLDPTINYSLDHPLSGKELYFEVEIVKIYKNCQES